MKITKQQRAARERAIQHACIAAVRAQFTGAGATGRAVRFVLNWLYASCIWFGRLLCLSSWGLVAGFLVGPEHEQFLTTLHAWMVATPASEVISHAHAFVSMFAVELVKIALFVGLIQKMLNIVKPAAQDAKNNFNQSLV
ncbi:hypothetical protein LPN04_30980 [Rugamonas sp. A1-17]|nr:hypothetical protein [Rugamonas sp. A1-17]